MFDLLQHSHEPGKTDYDPKTDKSTRKQIRPGMLSKLFRHLLKAIWFYHPNESIT